ncbi:MULTISPECIES: hypothetical protein [unclassified Bacillus cereus group]|uniref:hypothetical protein n=1 Tax=unclassified Bacillus cereus group TaxID=2750818 RepID=UPI001F5839D4|nr:MULTISPECIES: hypothetical protein [unclassified Bacillus cereus group]
MVSDEGWKWVMQSCTSAILEMDFTFGSKNPTGVSQLVPLGGVTNCTMDFLLIKLDLSQYFGHKKLVRHTFSFFKMA